MPYDDSGTWQDDEEQLGLSEEDEAARAEAERKWAETAAAYEGQDRERGQELGAVAPTAVPEAPAFGDIFGEEPGGWGDPLDELPSVRTGRAVAQQQAADPIRSEFEANLRAERTFREADVSPEQLRGLGGYTPADEYEARRSAADTTMAGLYQRSRQAQADAAALEARDRDLGARDDWRFQEPTMLRRARAAAAPVDYGAPFKSQAEGPAEFVGRNAANVGQAWQRLSESQNPWEGIERAGEVGLAATGFLTEPLVAGLGAQQQAWDEPLGSARYERGDWREGPYSVEAERIFNEMGPGAFERYQRQLGAAPINVGQISDFPSYEQQYGEEGARIMATQGPAAYASWLREVQANPASGYGARPVNLPVSTADVAELATNPINYPLGALGRAVRTVGEVSRAAEAGRAAGLVGKTAGLVDQYGKPLASSAAEDAGALMQRARQAGVELEPFQARLNSPPGTSGALITDRAALANALNTRAAEASEALGMANRAVAQNPTAAVAGPIATGLETAENLMAAPVRGLMRVGEETWRAGGLNPLARPSKETLLGREAAELMDAHRIARDSGEVSPIARQGRITIETPERTEGGFFAAGSLHDEAQAAVRQRMARGDLDPVSDLRAMNRAEHALSAEAKAAATAARERWQAGEISFSDSERMVGEAWEGYRQKFEDFLNSYTPTNPQQAARSIAETLDDSPLTPRVRRELVRFANDPANVRDYNVATRAISQMERLARSTNPEATEKLAALQKRFGVETADDLDPVGYAIGQHLIRFSKRLGVSLNENQSWAVEALGRAYNDWRAAVLMSGGYHLYNSLDIVGKSALEGFWGFSRGSTIDNFMSRMYGSPDALAELARTRGGGMGRINDELFATRGRAEALENIARQLQSGGPLNRTWGTGKAIQEWAAGEIEVTARNAAFVEFGMRQLRREVPAMERDLIRDLRAQGISPEVARYVGQQVRAYARDGMTAPTMRDAVRAHLTQRGIDDALADQLATRAGQRWALAVERISDRGLAGVSRIHFNYGERTNLETLGGFTQAVFPFTKWAISNLRYYNEALLSKPGLWNGLSIYDRAAVSDPEYMGTLPRRLQGLLGVERLPAGGVLAPMVGSVLWGDPRSMTFVNLLGGLVSRRQQLREGFYGEGATPAGKAISNFQGLTGMSFNPALQMALQMYGEFGDVPVSSPLGPYNVPGAALQAAYGPAAAGLRRLGVPATGSVERDVSTALRNVSGLNERFPSETGAGPLADADVNRRVVQQGIREGQDTTESPTVLRAVGNPASPAWQAANQQSIAAATNLPQRLAQGTVRARQVTPEQREAAQTDARWQQAYASGLASGLDEQAARRAAYEQVPNPFQMSPAGYTPEYAGARATLEERALTMPRGSLPPGAQWPGPNASREERDAYFTARNAARNEQAAAMQRGITRYDADQAELERIREAAGQRYADLQAQGFGPWSDQWQQARRFGQDELRSYYGRRANTPGSAIPAGRPLGPEDPRREQVNQLRDELRHLQGSEYFDARDTNPRYALVREADMADDTPIEAAWNVRQAYYRALSEVAARARDAGQADAYPRAVAANGQIPAEDAIGDVVREYGSRWTPDELRQALSGVTLPGYDEYLRRNRPPEANLQQAIRNKLYDDFQTPAERGSVLRADPRLAKAVYAGTSAMPDERATAEDLAYAAQRLGVTQPAQTVRPSQAASQIPREFPQDEYPQGNVYTRPYNPTVLELGGPRTQPVRPGVTGVPATEVSGAVRPALPAARGPAGGVARTAPGAQPAEPFSGRTPAQQWGSAWSHFRTLRNERGEAAAGKFVYDNYSRFEDLARAVGRMENLAPRGVFGRMALSAVVDRPEAYKGLTLAQGNARLGQMRGMLNEVRDGREFDRAAFSAEWQRRFGERLRPEDMTPDALQDKYDWVTANLAQARRYAERNPAGQKEMLARDRAYREVDRLRNARDEAREALSGAVDRLRAAAERASAVVSAGNQLQGRARSAHYAANDYERLKAEREAARQEYVSARTAYDAAREAYGKAFERARSQGPADEPSWEDVRPHSGGPLFNDIFEGVA
jgi:hypothetical protein